MPSDSYGLLGKKRRKMGQHKLYATASEKHYRATGETRFVCPICELGLKDDVEIEILVVYHRGEYYCPRCGAKGNADVDGVRFYYDNSEWFGLNEVSVVEGLNVAEAEEW